MKKILTLTFAALLATSAFSLKRTHKKAKNSEIEHLF